MLRYNSTELYCYGYLNIKHINCSTAVKKIDCRACKSLQTFRIAYPDALIELDGRSCPTLGYIPSTFTQLRVLQLYSTAITCIPSTFTQLEILGCNDCTLLTFIPSTFTKLTILDCSGSLLIRSIPSTLIALKRLYCSGCPLITEIPHTLTKLDYLGCSGCPLTHIPLKKLKTLCANRCYFLVLSYKQLKRSTRRNIFPTREMSQRFLRVQRDLRRYYRTEYLLSSIYIDLLEEIYKFIES